MPRRAPASCRSTATLKPPCRSGASRFRRPYPLAFSFSASSSSSQSPRPSLPLAPLPLHRLLRNAITPRATPYAQQPNPPTPPQRSYISVRLAFLACAIHPIPSSSWPSRPSHFFHIRSRSPIARSGWILSSRFFHLGRNVCLKSERERERAGLGETSDCLAKDIFIESTREVKGEGVRHVQRP